MPGITWDAEADRKILIEILKDPNLSANIDWDGLAAELSTETISCTVGGLKKRNSIQTITYCRDNTNFLDRHLAHEDRCQR
ncbi:hypothetical protein E4T44_06042 [Aureobasidium sp. EXF-8845]|nr:hypothetical protein E4T44_06042 [Aureobasidium sp. EXF-8845]KAI4849222.1 hypothetical protein E4T45_06001 [Aureobasidium sp. EXF-8846]